jgi:hypothetical protein
VRVKPTRAGTVVALADAAVKIRDDLRRARSFGSIDAPLAPVAMKLKELGKWEPGGTGTALGLCTQRWRGMRTRHLWLGDKHTSVWHHASMRLEHLVYISVCGRVTDARGCLLWPQKAGEVGPPLKDRCHACVAVVTGRPHRAAIDHTPWPEQNHPGLRKLRV